MRRHLLASLAAALAAGLLVWFYYVRYAPGVWSDFDHLWLAARSLLAGANPYVEVPKVFPWPFYYPLTAALIGVPFAGVSLLHGRMMFAALTAGICTWAILRHRPHAWPFLLSAPLVYALVRGQWAPLLVAGVLLPWLGGLIAAKPTVGLATFAYRPTVAALIGAALLGLIALAVQPSWIADWLATIRSTPHLMIPALEPGSVILLTAFARWPRPDARLLSILICVPQTPSIYELFALALVPRTLRQSLAVALCWNLLYLLTPGARPLQPLGLADLAHHVNTVPWPLILILGYVPVLLCVLWPLPLLHRPADFPTWPVWRQRAYRIGWGTALGLVGAVTLVFACIAALLRLKG